MLLQILVPRYKETFSEIKPLLDSIEMQHSVDKSEVEVLICTDGLDNQLDTWFFSNYHFRINLLEKPHSGVADTRQVLLENSTAEYIMFCDADDCFYTMNALWQIYSQIGQNQFDVLYSDFVEETVEIPQPGVKIPIYIVRENDNTFVHGKVYRRQFLIDNKVNWLAGSTFHEDSYFNYLACNLPGKVIRVTTPFYMWCYNPKSVCRLDPDYTIKTFDQMIYNNSKLTEEFIKRDLYEKAVYSILNLVYTTYINLNRPGWLLEQWKEVTNKIQADIAVYLYKYQHLWNLASDDYRQRVWDAVYTANTKYDPPFDFHIGFADWAEQTFKLGEELMNPNAESIDPNEEESAPAIDKDGYYYDENSEQYQHTVFENPTEDEEETPPINIDSEKSVEGEVLKVALPEESKTEESDEEKVEEK